MKTPPSTKERLWRPIKMLSGLLLLVLLLAFPQQAAKAGPPHTHKKQEHFDFHYPTRWSQPVQELMKRAPKDLQELEEVFGVQFKGVIRIRFSSPGNAFAKIQPHGWKPHKDIAGLAYPKRSLITMRIKTIEGIKGLHQTLKHELSHILISYAVKQRKLPLWFNEGVAMMVSHDYGDFERFVLMVRARLAGTIPALHTIRHGFPGHPAARQLAYATGLDAVTYLKKQRANFLPVLLQQIREGRSFHQAIRLTFGKSWTKLQQEWQQTLPDRYGWLPLLANEGTIWILIVILFLLAHRNIQARRRQRLAEMAAMEEAEEAKRQESTPTESPTFPLPHQTYDV